MEHASLSCIQCGHVWHPHYPHRKPRICPNCKSQHWEKPKEPLKETPTTPVVEVIDPPSTKPSDPGISNDELIEEILAVLRSGAGFRMSLEAEGGSVRSAHALKGAVEQ